MRTLAHRAPLAIMLVGGFLILAPFLLSSMRAVAILDCSPNGVTPWGAIQGYAQISCQANWYRSVGGHLMEDVSWQPDPTLRSSVWSETNTYYERWPSRTSVWWDNDGNLQHYYSKAVASSATGGSDVVYDDSGRYDSHYEWR